jgi:hypothetical protein
MLRHIAESSARLAGWAGSRVATPETSVVARSAYYLAGVVVGMCGGRLETRVVSFVIPSDAQASVERLVTDLSDHLQAMNIRANMKRTSLSAEEAMTNPEVRAMCYEAGTSVHFYEVFVPTHQCWRATEAIEQFMMSRAEDASPEA